MQVNVSQQRPTDDALRDLIARGSFEHQGETWPIAHATPVSVCRRYAEIVRGNHFHRALEIGTLFGLSTAHLGLALPSGGHLDTIDIRYESRTWTDGREINNVHEVAETLIRDCGLDDVVEFHVGNSNAILPELLDQGRRYDFALIDGSHDFHVALLDFVGVDAMLEVGGYIALDDVSGRVSGKEGLHGGPSRLLETLISSGRYVAEPINANVVVCRKIR